MFERQGGQWGWSGGSKGEYSEGAGELMVGARRAERSLGPHGLSMRKTKSSQTTKVGEMMNCFQLLNS